MYKVNPSEFFMETKEIADPANNQMNCLLITSLEMTIVEKYARFKKRGMNSVPFSEMRVSGHFWREAG